MQFTSGLSFVLYNKFSLAAQCTGGVGNACCLPRGIMHQVLGLVFRYLLIRTNPNHSKPHMFAGMKEPFFWVIPDRLRSVRLGGGQWPLRNFVFVFWLPPSPASDLGRDIEQPSSPSTHHYLPHTQVQSNKALACTSE
jgi:hypothetical protein